MKILYTVQKVTKDDELYGNVHYSDGYETLCGIDINESWFILSDDLVVNCKKCIKKKRDAGH